MPENVLNSPPSPSSPALQLRAVTIEGRPWFIAKDVCEVLALSPHHGGYDGRHLKTLDSFKVTSMLNKGVVIGGINGNSRMVNESGLYALVPKSRKPEAQAFRKWVTPVILPAIRNDGAYVMGEEKVAPGETM